MWHVGGLLFSLCVSGVKLYCTRHMCSSSLMLSLTVQKQLASCVWGNIMTSNSFNLCLCRIGCCTDQKGRLLQGKAVVTWSSDTSDVLLFMNLQFLWGYELFFLMGQPVTWLFCQTHTIPDGFAIWCNLANPAFFNNQGLLYKQNFSGLFGKHNASSLVSHTSEQLELRNDNN